ncbi:MAG: NAD(P)H-hydrate epimerase [Aigarchaeota archaeon]|nr:NAD(P)H-hydrate epimerase [Aigarchaeota archaeon]MCX8192719.1 NAD(P)H-hydrate epimerase [Nitrososphaeria archaeon]MDW7985971.1 NAD(P)H-hydrate epimerase [Nitrososphaerota archaeon]
MVFELDKLTISSREMMIVDENSEWLGVPRILLMENAGAAIARAVHSWIGTVRGVDVVVFCGLGNNGGDGMVAARHLVSIGAKVTVILLGSPAKVRTNEARINMEALRSMRESISFIVVENLDDLLKLKPMVEKAEAIVDAIFGTGIKGKIKEPWRTAIEMINSSKAFKLSVDIPSGVNPDTGEVEDVAVNADMTVTFHKVKRGIPAAAGYCGEVIIESIGIPPEAEIVMGPGDLRDALMDLTLGAKPVALINPRKEITSILEKLRMNFKIDEYLDCPIIYLGENVEQEYRIPSKTLMVSEGLRKEADISLIKDNRFSNKKIVDRCREVRELAVELGKIIYVESDVDIVTDGSRCKASWRSRPLKEVGSSTLRATLLFFLSHGLDPFRACCAAGYLAGFVEENGLEKLSVEMDIRKI